MTNRTVSILPGVVMGATVLALTGCSNLPGYLASRSSDDFSPSLATRSATVGQGIAAARNDQPQARMAITHGFTLRLPGADIEAVQRKHLDECAKLGCVVITTRLDRANAGRITASSSIRIGPDHFAEFAKMLTSPPAEVISHSQTAEDKTIPLLDLEKRIEIKSALRDRLTAMLKDSSAKSAADVLAIERELTQVQSDIESSIAQRDYLRTITETMRVDVNYTGIAVQTTDIDFYPIKQAAAESGETMARSLAQMITFVAAALPWLPLALLVAWGLRRTFRRVRQRT